MAAKTAQPDLSEFKRLGVKTQRKPCRVAEIVATMPDLDRPRLLAAFESDDEEVRRGAKRWLANREIDPPNDSAIASHRRKGCHCYD